MTYKHFPPRVAPTRDLQFTAGVPLGTWPANGPPAAYPTIATYGDGVANYMPSKVLSVHDGTLDWTCANGHGAVVLPWAYDGFTSGTFDVELLVDNFPGFHVAFLWWPVVDRWDDEIDFPESDTAVNSPYLAVLQNDPTTGVKAQFRPPGTPRAALTWHAWHHYTLDWRPGWVRAYQDGTKFAEVTLPPDHVPARPMRWTLQVEPLPTVQPGDAGHVYVRRCRYWV